MTTTPRKELLPMPPQTRAVVASSTLPGPAAQPRRFTLDGSPALENHLRGVCEDICAGVMGLLPPRKLKALMLGGGYGRGEGGVLKTPEGDRPYNDIEFYVFLTGNRHLNQRRHGRALKVLGEILTPLAGADVEFKIVSPDEWGRQSVSMFSYDLVMGHRRLAGEDRFLDNFAHHGDATRIPLSEATRLLMNRCSGLLLAGERLSRDPFTSADADFARRNIAKAELALGDALLTAFGQYHWSCVERNDRLNRLAVAAPIPWFDEVRSRHSNAVEFKLHPARSDAPASTSLMAPSLAEVTKLALRVFLWLEERRLNASFPSAREYAFHPGNKWPGSAGWRNLLLNLKAGGLTTLRSSRPFHHPRERVLNALALLLWEPETPAIPPLLHHVRDQLRTRASNASGLVQSYSALWSIAQ